MGQVVKTFILLAFLAGVITGCEQAARQVPANPSPSPVYSVGADQFPYQPFAKVVAYALKGDPEPVMEGTNLTGNVHQDLKVLLSKQQTVALLATLNDSSSYMGIHSRCFTPGIGYVFYDPRDHPVAHLTVCLACGNLRAEPELESEREALSTSGELKLLQLGRELFPGRPAQ